MIHFHAILIGFSLFYNNILITLANDCEDQYKNCSLWAADGKCNNQINGTDIQIKCQLSCGCNSSSILDEAKSFSFKQTSGCYDKSTSCLTWKQVGFCSYKYSHYMKTNCQYACGYCSKQKKKITTQVTVPNCRDKNRRCKMWALRGFCSIKFKSQYIREQCQKSCGICKQLTTTITRKQPDVKKEVLSSQLNICEDKSWQCGTWLKRGYCEKTYVEFMKKKCCNSCKNLNRSAKENVEKYCGYISSDLQAGVNLFKKIIGGKEVVYGTVPWQAYIPQKGRMFCGGVLVNSQFLLSAAHCFHLRYSSRPSSLYVYLGKHKLYGYDNGMRRFKVAEIRIHPLFDTGSGNNDIAILKLISPVIYSTYIRPACLPQTSISIYDGRKAWISGWGATSSNFKQSYFNIKKCK